MARALSLAGLCGCLASPEEQQEIAVAEEAICQADRVITEQACTPRLWPQGRIYYEFGASIPAGSATRATVEASMARWEAVSRNRIDFVADASQPARLRINEVTGQAAFCSGYTGGIVDCQLNASSWHAGHELGHGIGLMHSHLRSDRDRYLIVDDTDFPCNVWPNNHYNDMWRRCRVGDFGSDFGPFDLQAAPNAAVTRSIMMYTGGTAILRRSDSQSLTGGNPPLTEPEENDGMSVIELYQPSGWRKTLPRGRNVSATRPLDNTIVGSVQISGAPAISHTSCGNYDVYVRGSDNHIYQRTVTNGTWSNNYTDRATLLVQTFGSDPTASAAPDGSSKLLAATRNSNVYMRRYSAGMWGLWENLSGPTGSGSVCSAPALAQNSNEARVFVFACNGNLYERRRPNANNGTWTAWSQVAAPPAGLTFLDKPAAAASTTASFEVFVTTSNKRLFHLQSVNNVWGSWVQRATGLTSTAPAVAASNVGNPGGLVNVFYRSNSTPYSQVMWMTRISGNSYSTPVPISGQFANLAADMCSVVNIDLIGVMYDAQSVRQGLWHKIYFNP